MHSFNRNDFHPQAGRSVDDRWTPPLLPTHAFSRWRRHRGGSPILGIGLALVAALGIIVSGCADMGDDLPPGEATPTPPGTGTPGTVSLSQVQNEIFTPHCATSGCHTGGLNAAAGMDLSAGNSWSSAVDAQSIYGFGHIVTPSDPENSEILRRMRGQRAGFSVMPSTGRLPDAHIQLVEAWIRAGAPNQ